ncbi:telomere repeat-binding protein 1-like isoform X2 [Hevea brasiliensis]|uniref:telomere repeat-binding protein 1-like isoform X2 n=1 Tax=Hevea brasiliensis TaxID=3981 RepID=UPI0025CDAEAD|nr:telomere repeat-binding protein 1-like isoform X2 [Hevea brasiliensis]
MALLKFNPSRMGMTVTLVKEALGAHNFLQDNDEKVQSAPAQVQQRFLGVPDKDIQFSATGAVKGHKALKQVDSTGDSDDNRAWTLSEVMKLVQGVSRYGARRWSEIKRLAFASYSYRTSVDLKDKWRNLLKASLAQISSNKGINSRKNVTSMPIPEPILLRVRELAEMQSRVPPNLSSSKVAGNSVHEKQSGCL